MNVRYVISHIDKDGLRKMTRAQQGRNTHATPEEATEYLEAFLQSNTKPTLAGVYGSQALGTFKVSAIECWSGHNDPKGIYIRRELNPDQDVPEPWKQFSPQQKELAKEALDAFFLSEYCLLDNEGKMLIVQDFLEADVSIMEYHRRIGAGNLEAYAQTLKARLVRGW